MNVRTIGIAVIVVALVAAFTGIVSAVPGGATVTQSDNVTLAEAQGGTADAMGGNISQVNLAILQQTAKWQGYYGIVSGNIVLANAGGTSMFTWAITNRTGEVYATPNSSIPIWANYYGNGAATNDVNIAFNLGTGSGVNDNATDTFNETSHTAFNLSGNVVSTATGPCAKTQNATSASWETVILTDSDAGTAESDFLFVGLMQENAKNFAGTACDYQMIVPDNPEDTATTAYYFYVELS